MARITQFPNEARGSVLTIAEMKKNVSTPILYLSEFARWTQAQGFCKAESNFECQRGLSTKYVANNSSTGNGNIRSEMQGRPICKFPPLHLAWICTGEGEMIVEGVGAFNADYKLAYEGAMLQSEALNRIINQLNK